MTTRRNLFGLFAGAVVAPTAKALPEPAPVKRSGGPYAFTPTVSGYSPKPITWALVGPAPRGWSISPASGVLSHEPPT